MDIISLANKVFAVGTVLSQIFLLVAIIYLLSVFFRLPWIRSDFFKKKNEVLVHFFQRNGMLLALTVALVSMAASLFYSEIAGFAPCDLCWFQRVFMYPEVFLLGFAVYKKENTITPYALLLSVVGFFVSLYQNYMYYTAGGLNASCQFASGGVSCVKRYVFELGYVTIPIMALTAFGMLIIFLLLSHMSQESSRAAK